MENQSKSEKKLINSSSPAAVRMQRQKTGRMKTGDHNISQPIELSNQIQSQLQNSPFVTQTQPLSQDMNQQQTQMSGSQQQKVQHEQMEAKLAEAQKEIGTLRKKNREIQKKNVDFKKYMEREDKIRNELIEKQNLSGIQCSVVKARTVNLRETLSGLQEIKDNFVEFYNTVILKQDEKIKSLKGQLNNQDSIEEKKLAEPLRLKEKELVLTRTRYQQLEDEATKMTKIVDGINSQSKKFDRIICEDQQKHEEEIKKLLEAGKIIEENLNFQQEEKSKLLARYNENSERFKELSTEFQALEAKTTERKKQLEDSKSSIQGLQEINANLISELDALKSIHVAIISEKDSEPAVDRKKLQDMSLEYKETMNKLSEINSSNTELLDTVAEAVQHNEELKRDLLNKSDEKTKEEKALSNALQTNAELSSETQRLDEELIATTKVLMETEEDLRIYNTTQYESCEKESELRKKLAIAKQELQDKIDYKAKLRSEMSNEKLSSINEVEELKLHIELQIKQISEIKKVKENLRKENESLIAENEWKLQQLMQLPMQCQKAEHEKRINEQNMKIDFLRHQIQAEKLEQKQENIIKTETDRKEKKKREAQINELQSKIDAIEKAIFDTKDLAEDLGKILKKVQTSEATNIEIVDESLNSSQLLGVMFAKHQSLPTSSTPENSPLPSKRVTLEFDSFSDLSSVDGLDIFEAAHRNYAEYLKNNKTDSAKLGNRGMKDKS